MALLTKSSDARRLERNSTVKNLTEFFGAGVEAQHNWVKVDSQNLSEAVQDRISDIRIKQGVYGKVLCFTMRDSDKPILFNWSSQAPDYPAGTMIDPDTVTLTRFHDKVTDDYVIRASGEAL